MNKKLDKLNQNLTNTANLINNVAQGVKNVALANTQVNQSVKRRPQSGGAGGGSLTGLFNMAGIVSAAMGKGPQILLTGMLMRLAGPIGVLATGITAVIAGFQLLKGALEGMESTVRKAGGILDDRDDAYYSAYATMPKQQIQSLAALIGISAGRMGEIIGSTPGFGMAFPSFLKTILKGSDRSAAINADILGLPPELLRLRRKPGWQLQAALKGELAPNIPKSMQTAIDNNMFSANLVDLARQKGELSLGSTDLSGSMNALVNLTHLSNTFLQGIYNVVSKIFGSDPIIDRLRADLASAKENQFKMLRDSSISLSEAAETLGEAARDLNKKQGIFNAGDRTGRAIPKGMFEGLNTLMIEDEMRNLGAF